MIIIKAVMRTFCLFLLVAAFSSPAAAQALFEDGHYIDTNGIKHAGLISINSITDTQPYLLFKTGYRADPDTIAFSDVSEIRVSDFKLIRKDTETLVIEETTNDSSFIEQSLLLRVEVAGDATLYSTQSDDRYTFYFSLTGQKPVQLIYALYIRSDGRLVRDNTFRNQLANSLHCDDHPDFSSLRYNKAQLIKAFSDYNECINSEFKRYTGIPTLSSRYLNIGLGLGSSKYFVESTNNIFGTEIARFTGTAPYLEAEVEYLIPSLKNRIGFFFSAGYLNISDKDERVIFGTPLQIDLEYQVIQSTLGVRGYWPINNAFKLFGELGLGKDFETQKGISIDYSVNDRGYQDFENTRLTGHVTGGIGIAFFNRYIIQGKFKHLNSQISSESSDQRVKQSIFMIGFKYLLKSYYK
ncbi:hypothetical protein [Gracilimonas sp. BCB1]|uniref:hypothetical protein n=1 Tax=Gracilimonas sp. BCB1 TaxID=3152362 RepID=UPI0032D92904